MKKNKFKAVIFDLDGVITKTALVHSAAWKKMFDEYLFKREKKHGEPFREFSHEDDYLCYVDGKARYDGVESFLHSRGINLPYGDPSDSSDKETICGLGNMKNQAFNAVLERDGVEVYKSTVSLIHELKEKGFHVGVASSSKNCKVILDKAGLLELMETRVDGVVSAEMGLKGKPEPDIFTTAADNLGVFYDEVVVVEDAVSGVQAGKKGNFGLVLGIARENNTKELKINGADIVVTDISEIGFKGILKWFEEGLDSDNWSITYSDYIPEKEKTRETLLTVGNGYFGTRGAFEECLGGKINYPGTYIAGLYNRLTSKVGNREVENEDFVNSPNWLLIRFKIGDDEWIKINKVQILAIERNLNFTTGLLTKEITIRDKTGKETRIYSKRFASMASPHLGGISYEITPLNYSGYITIESGLNGNIINDGVERYGQLNQKHLMPDKEGVENNVSFLQVKTTESNIIIAQTAKVRMFPNDENVKTESYHFQEPGNVNTRYRRKVQKNETYIMEKLVSIFTSMEWDSKNPLKDSMDLVLSAGNFDDIFAGSRKMWAKIWDKIDIKIEGDRLAQKLLRMHLYHLMVSFSPNNKNINASITARGLHGEAYRGHIFWDELFILPLYNIHFPEVAKAALLYRYRRLQNAREYAKEHGCQGAMFPWQSGSDGREETQVVHLNPITGKWGDDYSSLQRHVSLAIAYNIWQYFHVTNDLEFMEKNGAEMFLEICRFWASKATLDTETGRYFIKNVMGPDEFHEKYSGSEEGGLKDNTYTNLMVVWSLNKAFELFDKIGKTVSGLMKTKIHISDDELENWKDIVSKMNVVIKDNILAQYDGYFDLKELDWDHYREKYGNIYRMDRLLKAEGKSADDYKVAKQADTLQTFYNLDEKGVTEMLENLGYQLSDNYLSKNLEYYLQRTSHGSTLSRVVHAQLANMINDKSLSWELYKNALTSDYNDIQGGTTGEGIHAGVMAGTVLIALQSYAGLSLKSYIVKFEPHLPEHWRSISFNFEFKSVQYFCTVSKNSIIIRQTNNLKEKVEISIKGNSYILNHDEIREINI
ncbi:MAG: beta-phosphoglucomutase family hydrolase [Bacteroidales bacterium]|nr:beta-phosphoglucomutase family hydrolase [Bacteroidales bacterium]